MSPRLFFLVQVLLFSIGLSFRFPLKTAFLRLQKSHAAFNGKVGVTRAKSWDFSVAASSTTEPNDVNLESSSQPNLNQKGFNRGVKKDGRKEAALQRSARKLAAERGPDYVEPTPMEEFQRLMATLGTTPSTKTPTEKDDDEASPLPKESDRLEGDVGTVIEGVEGSVPVVGKKMTKRAKKAAELLARTVRAEDFNRKENLLEEEYTDINMGQRTQPIGHNLRKSPTWRVPKDTVGKAEEMLVRERMNKVHHIGLEGTEMAPTGASSAGKYQEREGTGELDPLQQEPGIYLKDHFGPYVDAGERWEEKDEYGVPIKDPVELRNRRRSRPADSTRPSGLYEGGNILMKEAPDVDPSELQDLDPFQRSVWYSGGRPDEECNRNSFWGRRTFNQSEDRSEIEWDPLDERNQVEGYAEPQEIRATINAVITNSSTNCTALEVVRKVYDFIKNGTNNDPRIDYQINCYCVDDEAYPGMEDLIQMWLESYNTYHLIDGLAMREAWGCIMPHIVLGQKNLEAILEQVKFALVEDASDGALLSPRFRTIRLQGGGKQEMAMGYNNQHLTTTFSVVNTR